VPTAQTTLLRQSANMQAADCIVIYWRHVTPGVLTACCSVCVVVADFTLDYRAYLYRRSVHVPRGYVAQYYRSMTEDAWDSGNPTLFWPPFEFRRK